MARRPRTGLLTNYKVAPQTPSTVVGRPATPVTKKKGKAPEQTYTTQTTGMLSPVAVAPAAPAGNITGRPVATPSKPAPTPPKQTAPVGTPNSDPVKTQPGETGPFDPNAEAPVPTPTPEEYSEVELPPPSAPEEAEAPPPTPPPPPLPSDTVETVSEGMFSQYGDRLFPYVYTARNDDLETGQSRGPLDGLSVEMLSAQELYARFQQDNYAQRAFGDFDNYIGYLGDLLDLAEEHPEIAWWDGYGFRNLTGSNQQIADFYGLEDEDARSGSGARIDAESANLAAANEAFEAMLALPEFRQLVADRGIETQFRLGENDIYVFNGLTATEIHEGDDTFGSYFEAAMNIANRLTLAYMTGQVGDAGLSSLRNAAELGTLGPYSSSIGRVIDLMNSGQAGASIEASAVLNEVGPLIVNLGDDTQVEDPLAEAEEESAEEDGAFDPLLTGDPGDLFEPDTTLEEDPFEIEPVEPEEQEEPDVIEDELEIQPPTLPEVEEVEETDEQAQEAEAGAEPAAEEDLDILADTADDSDVSITEEMFPEFFPEEPAEQPPTVETEQPPAEEPPKDEEIGIPTPVETQPPTPIEQPSGVTTEEVTEIVNEAISNIPPGMTPEQVTQIVNEAIAGIQFPEGMTQEQVQQIVGSAIGNIQFPPSVSQEEVNQIVGGVQQELQEGIAGVGQRITDVEQSLQEALDAQAAGQTRELTEAEARLLSEITGVEAGLLQQLSTVEGGLNARLQNLGTDLDSVRDELGTSILGVQREVSDVERSLTEALEAATLGQATALSDAEARLLSQLTGIEADILQQMAASEAGLQQQLLDVGTNINQVRADLQSQIQTTQEETARSLEQASDERRQLQEALAAQAEGQARQLTEAEARLLSQITGVEANTLRQLSTVEGALNNQLNQLGTDISNVQNQLEQSIAGIVAGQQTAEQERRDLQEALIAVGGDVNRLDAQTRQQFEAFGEDVNQLFADVNVDIEGLRAGQISQQEAFEQYQESAATQAAEAAEERRDLQQSIINVQGDVSQLDENTRQQFEEFGGTVNDLFADVNVDIEALQEGQISQAEAQQAFQTSVAEQFGDVTGQLGALGGQVGGLMSEVSGIGQGLEGLGQGIAGIGEGLGAGLLGLAAQQAMLPGQIAAATPIQPQKFEKFQRGLTRRKLADPLRIGMFTGGARSV